MKAYPRWPYHGRSGKSANFYASLSHAAHGLVWGILFETNMRRQLAIGAVVISLGWWLDVTSLEWIVLLLAGLAVVTLELLNSAVEALADAVHPDYNEHIQRAKDLSAGAVLLVSGSAVIVGVYIFYPYLVQ